MIVDFCTLVTLKIIITMEKAQYILICMLLSTTFDYETFIILNILLLENLYQVFVSVIILKDQLA